VVDIDSQTGNTMLNKALAYINGLETLDDPTPFTIVLDVGWSMGLSAEQKTASINKENAVVTLVGKGPEPTVIVGCINAVSFNISGGTLILDKNITIKGHASESQKALVRVNSNGKLIMKEGAKITDSHMSGYYSGTGGVEVDGGRFTMKGGEISHNTNDGGGVSVSNSGCFTMKGGTITNNTGGGSGGGGGGGVSVSNSGKFIMEGGEISNNTGGRNGTNSKGGGGVYIDSSGEFTMIGGTISDNTACRYGGGGVFVDNGSFIMEGGTISGNTANGPSWGGGGVLVVGSFIKTGDSVIYGDDNNDPNDGNETDNTTTNAASGKGHAVYYQNGPQKYRDATLESGDDISTGDLSTNWEN
jgi:hypothetical protein